MKGKTSMSPIRASASALAVALFLAVPARADLDRGMTYFKAGRYVEAAAEFQSLVDHSTRYDYGFFMLGNCFLKLSRLDDAERDFKKALEIDARKFEYHYGLASAYLAGRRYPDALLTLASAEPLVDDSGRYAFHSLRGFALAAQENWKEAVPDLERAAALKKSPPVLDQLGKAYHGLGLDEKAARVLRESAALSPDDPETFRLLAEALLDQAAATPGEEGKKGLYEDALRSAQRFRSSSPAGWEGTNLVGRAALGARDFKIAAESMRQVLALKPDHCYAMINLAKCSIADERWKDAEMLLLDAARCAPKLALVQEILAFVLFKEDRLEDSLEACKRADALQPSPATRDCVAAAKGRVEQAGSGAAEERERRKKIEEYLKKHRDR